MDRARFLTVDNAQHCAGVFHGYMLSQYGFDVDDHACPVDPKKLLFKVMNEIAA